MPDGTVEVPIEDVEYMGKFADWMDSLIEDGRHRVDEDGHEVVEVPVDIIRKAAWGLRLLFILPRKPVQSEEAQRGEKSSESAA